MLAVPVYSPIIHKIYRKCVHITLYVLYRSMAYVPASRLQLDQRPQLYVTSRTQLQPLQQRITLSIIGIYYVNIFNKSTATISPGSLL